MKKSGVLIPAPLEKAPLSLLRSDIFVISAGSFIAYASLKRTTGISPEEQVNVSWEGVKIGDGGLREDSAARADEEGVISNEGSPSSSWGKSSMRENQCYCG